MAFNDAVDAYKKTNIVTASQGQLVVLLYEGAQKALKDSLSCFSENTIKTEDIERFSKSLQKAQKIISELQVSLDMDNGGELAKNLMSLYIYFNSELLDANIKHDKGKIEGVKKMIGELQDAWRKAAASTANTSVKGNPAGLNIEG